MKVLSAWLIGLMFVLNAYASETQDTEKEKTAPVKESKAETVEKNQSDKHDVLKTKFLGSRPYMESKPR
ncbi:hypothetical protein [Methylotenera mobilis]|uniref:Uncharacterized protein n=1 Tax=Methylotenera mobilis (strain JLW8 / ATCC BAA-1282 / DSM 17540) TaxID=583345 RepID=C6WXD6_METML|nr:hypothetical protein [Methylotenera mobilis]ACT48585.1 hypothetical protein Mmol_1681 [Methylotenera mobilis JLW8]